MADDRILIAEDDAVLARVMCDYLRGEGFVAVATPDGPSTLRLWRSTHPDVLILDWMLPGMSGLDVAREIRGESTVPIIMVTARGEEPDVVLALELGADDYLVKPVSLRQLSARLRAVLRRAKSANMLDETLTAGLLHLDLGRKSVHYGQSEISLTSTEFRLLTVLARHPGRVFSRLQLMESALGEFFEGYARTIDSHISHIRKKLGDEAVIETVHGMGYRLGDRL
ncbi:MAG: response regulator transcription factor [Sulfobacillus sp.]